MENYDLVVIGGGAAGLVTASGASRLGAKVALIERERMGGECLWTGCVPSKALIEAAKARVRVDRAKRQGIETGSVSVNFKRVMEHVRDTIKAIQPHDDPERFRGMGIEVIEGDARFTGRNTLEVDGRRLISRRFCIATGGDVVVPPIEGIDRVKFLTHESFFEIDRQPEHLIIIGAGPIGCELGQAMKRLGSDVTLIETMDCILHKDDHELSCKLHSYLEEEGITIKVGARAVRCEENEGRIKLTCKKGEDEFVVEGDTLLLATGKRPRTEGLRLDLAGVETERGRIITDHTMRTSNPGIYACGDVTGPYLFTHMAEYQAGLVVSNALVPLLRRKADYRIVPWCTFTDPELAHVGISEEDAKKEFGEENIRIWRYELKENDRHIIDGETKGVVKLITTKKGRILGCDMLGAGAGDLIHEYALAIKKGLGVRDISGMIHAYPTLAQANKRVSDLYFAEVFFKGRIPSIIGWWLRMVRPKGEYD